MDTQIANEFLALRRRAIHRDFSRMNDMQRRAVYQMDGPMLILAGAGSGKTTVLVNRIANMIRYGKGFVSTHIPGDLTAADLLELKRYITGAACNEERVRELLVEDPVEPWRILAITFTNKAAGELKDRLHTMLGEDVGQDVMACTFHSLCVRILRRKIDRLGYSGSFTIYDTDDSQRVIKDILKAMNIDDKAFSPKVVLNTISKSKDHLLSPSQMASSAGRDYRVQTIAKIYAEYQSALKKANALDFDDLISKTVELFRREPEILEYYQSRFKFIMVDEYQDTNTSQFELVSLLARKYKNLCVVGDDDQSIYKFRGATIENILNFEDQYKNAKVIRLEQNYRSTKNILNAANEVISHNENRKGKTLWTENETGAQIHVHRTFDEQREAQSIADVIMEHVKNGGHFSDHAILYRMNAQSNSIEKCFVRVGIPYRIIGGLRFYERKEIKDIIAYLSVVNNTSDTVRLRRVINEPKRGIGDTTISYAQQIAAEQGLSLFEVLKTADEYAALSKKSRVLKDFTQIIEDLQEIESNNTLDVLLENLLERTGYMKYMECLGDEGKNRIENIGELMTNIKKYMEEAEEPSLSGFLEEVSLYTDLDRMDDHDVVTMMTIHSAKGLEFDTVFIAGMEDGIFPGMQSIFNPEELEEERRLAYVALTRAKKELFLSNAAHRMLFGQTARNKPSRFIADIPEELIDLKDDTYNPNRMDEKSPVVQRRNMIESGRSIGISSAHIHKAGGKAVSAREKPKAAAQKFSVGDTVTHKVFGTGTVLSATPMANDTLVEVAFQKVGTKKIMANFAKLTRV